LCKVFSVFAVEDKPIAGIENHLLVLCDKFTEKLFFRSVFVVLQGLIFCLVPFSQSGLPVTFPVVRYFFFDDMLNKIVRLTKLLMRVAILTLVVGQVFNLDIDTLPDNGGGSGNR